MKTKGKVNQSPAKSATSSMHSAAPETAEITEDVEVSSENPASLIASAFADPAQLNPRGVLQLQGVMGNQAVMRLLNSRASLATPTRSTTGRTASTATIQRKVSIGAKKKEVELTADEVTDQGIKGTKWTDLEAGHPKGAEVLLPLRNQLKTVLLAWIDASTDYTVMFWKESQNKKFIEVADVYSALVGEVSAQVKLAAEGQLAQKVYDSKTIQPHIATFVGKLKGFNNNNKDNDILKKVGRYAFYYHSFPFGFDSVAKSVTDMDGNAALTTTIPIISDYILAAKNIEDLDLPALGSPNAARWGKLDNARKEHWNVNEKSDWVQEARANDAPLSAGPSATTAQVLRFAESLGASKDEKTALAWGLFAWWNKSFRVNQSGTHRFHEVMSVAEIYGVDYAGWALPDNAPDLAKKD